LLRSVNGIVFPSSRNFALANVKALSLPSAQTVEDRIAKEETR
jgi:hypothetical protein